MESNPKVTAIAVNGNAGPFTAITLTMMASKVRVQEDPAVNNGAAQGLTGFLADTQPGATGTNPNGGTSTFPSQGTQRTWLANANGQEGPAYQPICFGGSEGGRVRGGQGDYVGADGTVILYLTSASATATQVLLEEWA